MKILIGILKLTNWPNTFKTYIETTPIIIDLNMSLSNDITIILYAYFIIKYDKTKKAIAIKTMINKTFFGNPKMIFLTKENNPK